jgi:uncharacterized protein YecE (DUF72 family)
MTTESRAGTSGYSYKEWRGVFYPPDIHQDQWLSYYASRLPAVEINNTFYRMPRKHVVETWRDSVPESFRFVIKASRRITHQSRLNNAEESTAYLIDRAMVLGERLGAVLFQLPPYMRADVDRLCSFQQLLPDGLPVAFEFRHESWCDPAVDEALQSRGHAKVLTHDSGSAVVELMPNPLVYLRLRAPNYTEAQLRRWRNKVDACGAEQAFVFFKHEDAGGGPRMAAEFLTLGEAAAPAPKRAAPRKAPRKVAERQAAPKKPAARSTVADKVKAKNAAKRAAPKHAAAKKATPKRKRRS